MISHFLNFLKFNGTPGEYGSALWATIYILVIFAVASVAACQSPCPVWSMSKSITLSSVTACRAEWNGWIVDG